VTWQPTTELESATFGHTYYGGDNDGDAVTGEAAVSANLSFGVTLPANTTPAFLGYSIRWRSNATTVRTQYGFKDNQGDNPTVTGGWTAFGGTNAAITYAYQDNITNGYFITDPADYIDTANNLMNLRMRTSASTAVANISPNIDFVMVSVAWVEGPAPSIEQEAYRLYNNADSTTPGSDLAAQNTVANLVTSGAAFRLRVPLKVTIAQVPINTSFKLQYVGKGSGTCAAPSAGTPASYIDVTGATLIAYNNNATPTDGTAISANGTDPTSASEIKYQTYEEINNIANSVSAISQTQSGLWDFALFDNGAAGSTTYCLRVVAADGTVLNTYTNYPEITTATSAPNTPTALAQKKVDDSVIATGNWSNQNSVKFTVSATDGDASDTLYLCVESKDLATAFTNAEDLCGTGIAYSGVAVTPIVTLTSITDATQYHWQVRVKDQSGLYSAWVSYGGNAESAADFGIDTTAPSGGTVYDGTGIGVDVSFNNGSLSSLSANWDGIVVTVSGLLSYDYSIGTTMGGTDVLNWANNGTGTTVTAGSLVLQSSVMYYFNLRTNDNAGNSTIISSNGQLVAPSLAFSLSASTLAFSNLNSSNNYTDTKTTTLTTSTNAYNGYVIRLFKTDLMRSTVNPSFTIADFAGGTYSSPAAWTGPTSFGYTSSDTSVQGNDIFNSASCLGGGSAPCYAPITGSAPGDIIADRTATVSGTPVSNEQFTITYKIQTSNTQRSGPYSTSLVYTIVPQY